MLQQPKPEDYVIATGQNHSVREFVEAAAGFFDFDLEWQGRGLAEVGVDKKTRQTLVKISENYFRPTEVDELVGDYSKAKQNLGWAPKVGFAELVQIMCQGDFNEQKKENHL